MLNLADVKLWIHRDMGQLDKLLIVLASIDGPCQIKCIRERAAEAGYRFGKKLNLSSSLGRSKGLAIRTSKGWEVTDAGKQRLREIGVTGVSPSAMRVATDFRAVLSSIKDENTRFFVEEAIKCYETKLYRSAVVMSWIGAIAVLQGHICANHLKRFNSEAKRVDARWKEASTTDDLNKMREADFLERIASLSIIGNDVKKELINCLNRRNSCGHPNSLRISENTVAHHVEVLLLNVFKKLQ